MASKLEKQFALMWEYIGGPKLEREFRFHPSRQWKADFAHPEARVIVEIEGGVWASGRHTRGSGFVADAEKYNTAALSGWLVFRLPDKLITRAWCERIAECIADREKRLTGGAGQA